MKSLLEELGGTYTLGKDGMYYPNLAIEEADQCPIGKWGRMYKRYLIEQRPVVYNGLVFADKLQAYLVTIDQQASERIEQLISKMAAMEGVNEALKAADQMEWVKRMNSIRNRAEEIVQTELIFV